MKISIVGLGKMGSLVQKTAQEENIEVVSTIDPHQKDADFSEIDEESLQKTDVCICFTQPAAALENIEKIASLKKKIVMATTGWVKSNFLQSNNLQQRVCKTNKKSKDFSSISEKSASF